MPDDIITTTLDEVCRHQLPDGPVGRSVRRGAALARFMENWS